MKRLLAVLAALPCWSACLVWLDVPDETQVACGSDLDCPLGFVCRPSIGRCIRAGRDEEAPAIDAASVRFTPESGLARALQRVEVTLQTSDPLFRAPDVSLGVPGSPAWQLVDGAGSTWTYAFVPSGTEPEGTWPVLINMVDEAGNTATGVVIGTLTLDFTAPTLVTAPTVSAARLNANAQTTLQLTASETLKSPPELTLRWPGTAVEREATWMATAAPSTVHAFTYQADGDEPEGAAVVHVALEDLAGNRTELATSATVVTDFTPTLPVPDAVSISWEAPPGALRADVDSVTYGSTVRVTFLLDAEVAEAPVVTSDIDAALQFTAEPTTGDSYEYALTIAPGSSPTPGEHGVLVSTRDSAGNPALTRVGSFVVDVQPPAPPSVEVSGRVRHRRLPWGGAESAGTVRFQVHGTIAAVEGGARVLAYDVVAGEERIVASGDAAADGSFTLTLPLDSAAVRLQVVDGAGNAAGEAPVTVRDTEWVASLGGKVVGQAFGNPHRFEERWRATHALQQFDAVERGEASGVFLAGGNRLTTGGRGSWRSLEPREEWVGRGEHAVASDPARGRVVMFGGLSTPDRSCDASGFAYCGGTWEWDGSAWVRVQPLDPEGDGDPSARIGHVMAYHAGLAGVVMFGGKDPSGSCDGEESVFCRSTWLWNGSSWDRLADGAEAPLPRLQAAMAYDAARDRLVLFGGHGDAAENVICTGSSFICGDTWEFDGVGWSAMTPGDTEGDGNPSPRFAAAAAYDDVRARVVLFGGQESDPADPPQYAGDTWEWDGARWSLVATDGPGARAEHAMMFDPLAGHTLLVGGLLELPAQDVCPPGYVRKDPGCTVDDAWTWDGTAWTEWSPLAGGTPGDRFDHQLAFDARTGGAVLVGGNQDIGDEGELCSDGIPAGSQGVCTLGDTWLLSDERWHRRAPADAEADGFPVERAGHALARNPDTGELLLYGGQSHGASCDDTGVRPCSSLWSWRNGGWTRLATSGPAGSGARAFVYEDHLDRALLLGEFRRDLTDCANGPSTCDDSWVWDGATWTALSFLAVNVNKRPAARCGYSVAYDAARQRVLLFGGYAYADPNTPGVLDCSVPRNQRELAGITYYDDTWTFDGAGWVLVVPGGRPPGEAPRKREDGAMVYDAAREEVVLFGGRWCQETPDDPDSTCNSDLDYVYPAETWVWTGSAWALRAEGPEQEDASSWPLGRRSPALAYDMTRERVVMFGGDVGISRDCGTASALCRDLWEWDGTTWVGQPAGDPEGDLAPSARAQAALGFDDENGQVLLFGGAGGLDDTWAWQGGADGAPAHVAHVLVQAAQVPADAEVGAVQVRWRGGARALPDGVASDGVRLLVWDRAAWRQVGSGAGTPEASEDLSFEITDAATLTRLLGASDGTMHWMLAPTSSTGAAGAHATVATDHFELELRYRLP